MATLEELKTGLETAFDAEGAKGIEATIQINIEDLTNFYVDINDGTLSVVESEHEDPDLHAQTLLQITFHHLYPHRNLLDLQY